MEELPKKLELKKYTVELVVDFLLTEVEVLVVVYQIILFILQVEVEVEEVV